MSATFLRVGLLAVLVGHLMGCPREGAPRQPSTPPELVIAPIGVAGSTDAGANGVRFGHPAAIVGSAWTVDLHASSTSLDQNEEYDSLFRVEVLAVEGPAPSRLSVHFLRNSRRFQGATTPTAIAGKRYVVDSRAPHLRDETGAAAPPGEAERVLDILPELGTRARIDEVLPDDAIAIGARYDALVPALLRVLHPRAWRLDSGSATLVGTEGEDAVFDVALLATSETLGASDTLRMDVKGAARVRLSDARLSSLVLRGTYGDADDAGDPGGTFDLTRTISSDPGSRSGR